MSADWLKELDPEVVNLVVWKDAKAEVKVGDLRCRLFRMCPSYAVVLAAVEAAAAGIKPVEVLRYCVACKTDARTVFDRLVKCVEVREHDYLFVINTRDGKELRLIYDDLDEAFENLNELFAEHHHLAVDDSEYQEFVNLTYTRAAKCA